MILFLDLDGPILDVSDRYYRVYRDILINRNFDVLEKQGYWNAKRQKITEIQILNKTGAGSFYKKYLRKRLTLIENDFYLFFDSVQEGAIEFFEKYSKRHRLVIVTLRKDTLQLIKQLVDLDLKKYFSHVLSSSKEVKPHWKVKYDLIKGYLVDKSDANCVLIGDTETDIIAGNELGLTTIGVLNGIRTKKLLLESNPDFIYKSFEDFVTQNQLTLLEG